VATTEVPRVGVLARLSHYIPTVLVTAFLAGLGAYGHHSGWKVPKFSTLAGNGAAERKDWCEEHGVPESQCVERHPDLLPPGKDYGWCKEHGLADCPLCHPEVTQLKQTPVVSEADRHRPARALAAVPRPGNNPVCKTYRRRFSLPRWKG
jgi:cobalt-zinc-cadmium efflux system membrane fusion protein